MIADRAVLQLTGMLVDGTGYVPVVSHLAERSSRMELEEDAWLQSCHVELLDGRGTLLSRTRVPMTAGCRHPVDPALSDPLPALLHVAGEVPWIAETAVVRVVTGDKVQYELLVPPAPPKLSADWSALAEWESSRKTRLVPVGWSAESPVEAELQYRLVCRSEDDHERPLTTWQHEPKALVEPNELPAGKLRLVIQASDGIHVAEAASEPVEVPVRPCRVAIFSPADGAKLSGAQPVELWGGGACDDLPALRPVSLLEWSSSVDGVLGEGPGLEVMLQPGRHEITLTGGSGDRRAATAVSVSVT